MSRISTNGHWKKTGMSWRYVYDGEDQDIADQISSAIHTSFTAPVVWQCVVAYITSAKDLRNLAATCRLLRQLAESELAWSYLIRTKFGIRLWRRHVRLILQRPIEQEINLHTDIDTMDQIEALREWATIPPSFLFNRADDCLTPVTRAIVRSYRYYLATKNIRDIVYLHPSGYIFRQMVTFKNIPSEHLTDAQRQTAPLSKLLYFYQADERCLPAVDFSMIFPRENVKAIVDPKASTGHALQLSICFRVRVLQPYHSIIPGRYEIFWRLRYVTPPSPTDNLEFIAVPRYGLMAREHTSSEQFAKYVKQHGKDYFRRSMGIITVFKRCTVFIGCLDLTTWRHRSSVILDYVEMVAVE